MLSISQPFPSSPASGPCRPPFSRLQGTALPVRFEKERQAGLRNGRGRIWSKEAANWEQVWVGGVRGESATWSPTAGLPPNSFLRCGHKPALRHAEPITRSLPRAPLSWGGRTRSSGQGWRVGSGGGGAQVTRPCPAPTPTFPPQNPTSFIMTSRKRPRLSWAFNKLLPKEWEQLQWELLERVRAPFIVK